MKRNQVSAVFVVLLVVLFGGGYWLLVRKKPSPALPPVPPSNSIISVDQNAFDNEQQLDRKSGSTPSLDDSIRALLAGHWRCNEVPYIEKFFNEPPDGSDGSADFVEISPDGSCRFSLHEFDHVGRVSYERSYAGFFTEFQHNDKTYIFVFSAAGQTLEEQSTKGLAVAFVGHDPKPLHREIDYEGRFTRSRVGETPETLQESPAESGRRGVLTPAPHTTGHTGLTRYARPSGCLAGSLSPFGRL